MDRVAQEGKMKEKENEITDLADCTNHAYHVLWLARRIQHLWITVAIIVHERTGMGEGGELWFVSLRRCVSESLCSSYVSAWMQVCFSWHAQVLETQRKMIKESYGNACCSLLQHILGEPPTAHTARSQRLHLPM